MGVYDHIPGDGRELVATEPAAVTVTPPAPLLASPFRTPPTTRARDKSLYTHCSRPPTRPPPVPTRARGQVRAEDGRSVQSVDISPFISNLPFGKV